MTRGWGLDGRQRIHLGYLIDISPLHVPRKSFPRPSAAANPFESIHRIERGREREREVRREKGEEKAGKKQGKGKGTHPFLLYSRSYHTGIGAVSCLYDHSGNIWRLEYPIFGHPTTRLTSAMIQQHSNLSQNIRWELRALLPRTCWARSMKACSNSRGSRPFKVPSYEDTKYRSAEHQNQQQCEMTTHSLRAHCSKCLVSVCNACNEIRAWWTRSH